MKDNHKKNIIIYFKRKRDGHIIGYPVTIIEKGKDQGVYYQDQKINFNYRLTAKDAQTLKPQEGFERISNK